MSSRIGSVGVVILMSRASIYNWELACQSLHGLLVDCQLLLQRHYMIVWSHHGCWMQRKTGSFKDKGVSGVSVDELMIMMKDAENSECYHICVSNLGKDYGLHVQICLPHLQRCLWLENCSRGTVTASLLSFMWLDIMLLNQVRERALEELQQVRNERDKLQSQVQVLQVFSGPWVFWSQ